MELKPCPFCGGEAEEFVRRAEMGLVFAESLCGINRREKGEENGLYKI